MTDVTIAIGRNVDGEPMYEAAWRRFKRDLRERVRSAGGEIVATVGGDSGSAEWGGEQAYWVAASIPDVALADLRESLGHLAAGFQQDAVALTVGETTLVGADAPHHGHLPSIPGWR